MPNLIENQSSNMKPTVTKIAGLFYLTEDGEVIKTPAGHPVGCVDKQVAVEAADAYNQFGSDPGTGCSLYALLCTYLDFGGTPVGELIASLLQDFEDDIVYREVAMLTAMDEIDTEEDVLDSPWPEAYLRSSGFYDHWEVEAQGGSRIINDSKISNWLSGELESLPPRALMTLVYCSANWRAMLPALALIRSEYGTEDFKELIEDRVSERESALIDHLRAFAALPEDRDAVIANVESTAV
jgi:hypothetical protein